MNTNPEVFITDTHTRMALAIVRELGQAGYLVVSITREGYPSLGHASRYTARCVTLPSDGYADALLDLAAGAESRPVLLPAGMHTLNIAAQRYEDFTRAFRMLLSTGESLTQAGDKPSVAEVARSCGLSVPAHYPHSHPLFPCVIKYRNGEALQLKADFRYAIVHDESKYEETLNRMENIGEVFVSQYIPGIAFGVSAVLDENSRPLAVFCHERVREYPLSGGPACCARSIWHYPLAKKGLRLLKALGLRGFAMVEFKGTLEQPYVLEVNPRIWGTYPLSRLCGASMAEAYVRNVCGGGPTSNHLFPFAHPAPYFAGRRMQYFANDLAHFAARLRQGKWAGGVWADFFSPACKGGVLDVKDIPGSWAYVRGLVRNRV